MEEETKLRQESVGLVNKCQLRRPREKERKQGYGRESVSPLSRQIRIFCSKNH